jgi:hypothetical protein
MAVVTVAAVIVAVAAVIVAVAAVVAPITAVVATAAVVAHSAEWASWAKSGGRSCDTGPESRFDSAARRHEHIFHCSTLQVSMFIDNVFGGFVNTSWA